MPFIQVTTLDGLTEAQTRKLIASITKVVVEDMDVPEQAVHVVVQKVPSTDWGNAGVPLLDKLG